MPLQQRVPKLRGFNNPFRVAYQAINLDVIEASGLDEVTPETLHEPGLVPQGRARQGARPGRADPRRARCTAHGFSAPPRPPSRRRAARVERCRCRSADGRPPARGNQHTNR